MKRSVWSKVCGRAGLMNHADKYVGFDLLRGVSALLVCAGHLGNYLVIDYGQMLSPQHGISCSVLLQV